MEKARKNKYGYSAISIKADVAISFRRYSKQFQKSNSEVLQRMLFFLEWNGLDPFESSIKKIVSGLEKNRKLIEYLISILKSIEKKQTKPTYEMVKILFEAHGRNEKCDREEIPVVPQRGMELAKETVPKGQHEQLKLMFDSYRKDCKYLLEKIDSFEPTFGKPYLKVDLTQVQFEQIKRELVKNS